MRRKLIKIGNVDVHNALGFLWNKEKIVVARTREELVGYAKRHRCSAFGMLELEACYRHSPATRSISWCSGGCIVRQGASVVTFNYTDEKARVETK